MDRPLRRADHAGDLVLELLLVARERVQPGRGAIVRGRLHGFEQIAQHEPHIADDGKLRHHAAADLGRVDVDLDVGGARIGHVALAPVGLLLLEAAAETEHDVRLGQQSLGQPGAVMPDAAGRERMIVRQAAAARQVW